MLLSSTENLFRTRSSRKHFTKVCIIIFYHLKSGMVEKVSEKRFMPEWIKLYILIKLPAVKITYIKK